MSGKINQLLKNKTVVYLDTSPLIYWIEENPIYLSTIGEVFARIDQGILSAISSFVTLIELLVQPLKMKRYELAEQYRDLLMNSTCFTLYPLEQVVAERAVELRVNYSLRVPDAVQMATAISFGAQLFVTNDDKFRKISEIEIMNLDDYR